MSKPPEKSEPVDLFKKILERTTMPTPETVQTKLLHNSGEADARPIPQPFLDAILEVIAKSIEQALADVMARCVSEGIEKGLRPFVGEVALLRIAIEHDWRSTNRRRQHVPSDAEDGEE